jgi:outer membrane protein assembly factor BamA
VKAGKTKELFGQPFDQYAKFENEFRYYHKVSRKSTLAAKLFAGVGVPYGNSKVLPYSKQFFIGGSNSLRGFRARSLGPGTYNVADAYANSDFFPDESGDIKLEASLEYRPHLFSIVDGALFTDAGNIWLFHSNVGQPGGEFTGQFINQLAADVGAGLRIDATVLVLRLDLGMPIRKPWLPKGDRWVFDEIDFGSSTWRRDNLILNIAIGYPF